MDEARRLFARAAEANPHDPVTYQAWALLEKEQGNVDEARRLFARAAEADPGTPRFIRPGPSWRRSRGTWTKPGASSPAPPRPTPGTPRFIRPGPSWRRSRGTWTKPGASSPAPPRPTPERPGLSGLGLLEAQNRRPAEARRILEEGLSRVAEPRGRALLHSALGGLLARQGEYEAAEEQFRRALELDPRNPLTHYHYAVDCLIPQHRIDEACRHLREAERIGARRARDRRRIQKALREYCTEYGVRNTEYGTQHTQEAL